MSTASPGNRPWCAPAVAMEHWQCPEVDRIRAVPRVNDFGDRIEIRSAVGVLHTLRLSGGPRGVVDRNGPMLVVYSIRQRFVIASPDECRIRNGVVRHFAAFVVEDY